jgi:DGQHR domain-containing protein
MILPFKDNVAKVLDGQHRIAGLENYQDVTKPFEVTVTIFIGMELEDQAIVFATINKTQTKVNKSLVADLFSFATHRSPQKTAHNIVRALNQRQDSPFKDKFKILGTASDITKETITQATFSDALMRLYSKDVMIDRDTYKRGKVPEKYQGNDLKARPLRNIFVDEQDAVIAKIIWEYFKAVERRWPSAWNLVQEQIILNKSTGFLALISLFRDMYNHLKNESDVVTQDEYLGYFNMVQLADEDFNRNQFIPGSGGQSLLYQRLKADMNI